MNKFKTVWVALALGFGVLMAAPAQAIPVLHNFFLENSSGTPDFTGTLTIDSSRLGTAFLFTPLSDPSLSLSITILGDTYTKADAFNLDFDGVITDGSGALTSFHDSAFTRIIFDFDFPGPARLNIGEGQGDWIANLSDSSQRSGPSHSFRPVAVPEPPTALLFALALMGLVALRRKRETGTLGDRG